MAFSSFATDLVRRDTNEVIDVFVHDPLTGTTERASVDSVDGQANDPSTDPAINGDGSVTAFFSVASILVAGDTSTCPVFRNPGQCADIFRTAAETAEGPKAGPAKRRLERPNAFPAAPAPALARRPIRVTADGWRGGAGVDVTAARPGREAADRPR